MSNEASPSPESPTSSPALEESDTLLDGQIPRVFQPRRTLPTDVVRPTRAEVNLESLRHNLHVLRNVTEGKAALWAVLKADGYGHGAKAVARTLERAKVDGICVALVEEGVELREAGISVPILVMGGYTSSAFRELVHYDLTPLLHEPADVEQLALAVRSAEFPSVRAHLKVDTGMGRLGSRAGQWKQVARSLKEHPEISFDGLMTHFANADTSSPDALDEPLRLFEEATQIFASEGLRPRLRHAANSAAILRGQAHFDVVRPGIALFGVDPLPERSAKRPIPSELSGKLRPVMSIQSRIVALRELREGDPVGYGSTWSAKRTSKIATVPMGYADGYSRALSNRGSMLVRGRRAPIVGIVSMDMTMIDVTDIEGATLGDDVVLLGQQRWPARATSGQPQFQDEITATEIAEASDTISWEVLTTISRRVPRFYREA